MTAAILPASWLQFLREEYLQGSLKQGSYREGFIKEGGASVKFAIPLEEEFRDQIENEISEQGRLAGYIIARVSSADTRVHMMDQVFFRVAEQIPWRELSRKVLINLASEEYAAPPAGDGPLANSIAAANSISLEMVRMKADQWVDRRVFHQQSLSRDFRVAVAQLCLAELYGGPDGETREQVIEDWLTGRNRAISAVKPYQIFTRVSRSNARHLLESLLRWIRFAGYPGLVIVLDTSRLTIAKNPHDSYLYYTKAAMLDAYEVLRQFIDGTDRMTGCLLIVTPASEFLDVEPFGRGMGAYNALRLRVYDEVRDQRLVNPMGTMVRLSREAYAV
jgi:P-loop Domain of unknown function (DUF2791)